MVGEPSGRDLWTLARQRDPAASIDEALVERAAAMGYNVSMLIRAGHSAAPT